MDDSGRAKYSELLNLAVCILFLSHWSIARVVLFYQYAINHITALLNESQSKHYV